MKDKIVEFARKAKLTIPFYKSFYSETNIFGLNSIPILTKSDIKKYENDNGPYWEMKGSVTTTSRSTGEQIEVQNDMVDFTMAIYDFLSQTIFPRIIPHIITTEDFVMSPFITGKYVTTIPTSNCENIDLLTELFDLTEKYENVPVLVLGRNEWIGYLANNNLLKENNYIIHMPKYNVYPSEFDGFKVGTHIFCFSTTENGLLGYYTSKCSCKDYHMYRSDVLMEEVDSHMIVSFIRECFPFIRYDQDDKIKIKDVKCSCGFTGQAFEYLGRV